jgi:hypothetical protein
MALQSRRNALLVACAILAASLAASAAWAQDTIRLEMKPAAGEFTRYDAKMNLELKIEGDFSFAPEQVRAMLANPIQLAIDMTMTQKVKDVMPNGDFGCQYGFEKLNMSAMGMKFDATQFMPKETMAGMPMTVMSKRGTLVGFEGADGKMMTFADMMTMMPGGMMPADMPPEAKEMMGKIGEMMQGLIGIGGYPDKDLSVGESWATPGIEKLMGFFGITDAKFDNKLQSIQTVNGAKCAEVEQLATVNFDLIDLAKHMIKTFGIEKMAKEKGGEEGGASFTKFMGVLDQIDAPVKCEGTSTMMVRLSDGIPISTVGSGHGTVEAKNLQALTQLIQAEAGGEAAESKLPKIGDKYKITVSSKMEMKLASDQGEPKG